MLIYQRLISLYPPKLSFWLEKKKGDSKAEQEIDDAVKVENAGEVPPKVTESYIFNKLGIVDKSQLETTRSQDNSQYRILGSW